MSSKAVAEAAERDPSVLAYNLLLKGDLLQISSALGLAQIEHLVLKGLPIAEELYGGLAERKMLDNDLLVRRTDAGRAHQVLETLGFRTEEPARFELSLAGNFQHPLYRKHPGGVVSNLDLHWSALAPHLFAEHEELWFEGSREFQIDNQKLRIPCRELGLIQLAGHLVQHSLGQPRILRDIGRAWQTWYEHIDVPKLSALAEQLGAKAVLDYALRTAHLAEYTSLPSPRCLFSPQAGLVLAALPLDKLLNPEAPIVYRRAALSWLLLTPEQALKSVKRELIPSRARMQLIHPDDNAARLTLRYAQRPLRLLLRR